MYWTQIFSDIKVLKPIWKLQLKNEWNFDALTFHIISLTWKYLA